jgi:hypothetical protein
MIAVSVVLVLGIGVGVLGQVDPFSSLSSSVATVETWVVKVADDGGSADVWVSHDVVNYDAEGRSVETITYAEDGSVEQHTVRSYDESGRLMQAETHNAQGDLEARSCYTYEGGVRVEASYGGSGDLQRTVRYELDPEGHVVRATREGQGTDEVESSWESTYSPDGEPLTLRMYDDQGDLAFAIDFNYDVEDYDVVSTFSLYLLGEVFMTVENGVKIVARDEHGNWTEMRSYDHKEVSGEMTWVLSQVSRREITYREE